MKILGISAVTKVLSVALIDGGKLLGEKIVTGEQAHSEQLVFFIGQLFRELNFDKQKLQGIAVAQGPGSYSGIRGGMATAKTMAQVLNIPVVGISTLEAMAYGSVSKEGEEIVVVLAACRNEVNTAKFKRVKNGYRRLTADGLVKAGKVAAGLKKVASGPRGENVARLGLEKLKNGEKGALFPLQPKYSLEPNIRTFSGGSR